MSPLPRAFYRRPAPVVAPDLLGRLLVRTLPDGERLAARIVECEAYQEDDPASHSYRGLTPRTEVMFGPPGHLYVYLSYGAHWCMNVVTGRDGEGSAVLLRAAEPLDGIERMRANRGLHDERLLCAGPGRLTQALGITRDHNGIDLVKGGELVIAPGRPLPDQRVRVATRVGLTVAREQPWRFIEAGSPYVSRGRTGGIPWLREG
ncbi:MAG: DNA-3-methyladenine glycosylase [Actinomycetota bacterium]